MKIELSPRELGLAILALNVAQCEQASKSVEAFLDGNTTRHNELIHCCEQCAMLAEKLGQLLAHEFRGEG